MNFLNYSVNGTASSVHMIVCLIIIVVLICNLDIINLFAVIEVFMVVYSFSDFYTLCL